MLRLRCSRPQVRGCCQVAHASILSCRVAARHKDGGVPYVNLKSWSQVDGVPYVNLKAFHC